MVRNCRNDQKFERAVSGLAIKREATLVSRFQRYLENTHDRVSSDTRSTLQSECSTPMPTSSNYSKRTTRMDSLPWQALTRTVHWSSVRPSTLALRDVLAQARGRCRRTTPGTAARLSCRRRSSVWTCGLPTGRASTTASAQRGQRRRLAYRTRQTATAVPPTAKRCGGLLAGQPRSWLIKRSTYFAMTSTSRFTRVPTGALPTVVSARVVGINDTSNQSSSAA